MLSLATLLTIFLASTMLLILNLMLYLKRAIQVWVFYTSLLNAAFKHDVSGIVPAVQTRALCYISFSSAWFCATLENHFSSVARWTTLETKTPFALVLLL